MNNNNLERIINSTIDRLAEISSEPAISFEILENLNDKKLVGKSVVRAYVTNKLGVPFVEPPYSR